MAPLHAKLQDDLKNALKSGERTETGVLRLLLASIHNREIEKKTQGKDPSLSDEEVIEVLSKEVKKRKEAIELFKKGNRGDLAQKEEAEIKVIVRFLPQELSREEIEKEIEKLVASGQKDFGSVIKEAMSKMKGRADSRLVAEIIKEKLGEPKE